MKKLEQLYDGKAKKVFLTEDPDILIVDYKDDATAFNGSKRGTIAVEIVPSEVIVRNVAAGSFSKRLGIPEGTEFAELRIFRRDLGNVEEAYNEVFKRLGLVYAAGITKEISGKLIIYGK